MKAKVSALGLTSGVQNEDTNMNEFINFEELSDRLSDFDDRLSYGSEELIGDKLNNT